MYCILQSDAILLRFGFFGHFKDPLSYLFTILQQQKSFAVKEKITNHSITKLVFLTYVVLSALSNYVTR